MQTREMTASASRLMVEQMVASGVKYVFNNSGSREALFFNELHARSDIHGILGLHEGAVTAMAGGYTQANLAPGVMVVHLGAGAGAGDGSADQRVDGQPAGGGDHLRGGHRQLRRQDQPGREPQCRPDRHRRADDEGELDGHRAGGTAGRPWNGRCGWR